MIDVSQDPKYASEALVFIEVRIMVQQHWGLSSNLAKTVLKLFENSV